MLKVKNDRGEYIMVGYEKASNRYFIDRTHAGITEFHKEFAQKSYSERISVSGKLNIKMLLDRSSIELFADDGLTVMTSLYFPNSSFNKIELDTNMKGDGSGIKCYALNH
jgi:fructan beta-fructosidase